MNGECKTKVPVTPSTVYNISINDKSQDKKVSDFYLSLQRDGKLFVSINSMFKLMLNLNSPCEMLQPMK